MIGIEIALHEFRNIETQFQLDFESSLQPLSPTFKVTANGDKRHTSVEPLTSLFNRLLRGVRTTPW